MLKKEISSEFLKSSLAEEDPGIAHPLSKNCVSHALPRAFVVVRVFRYVMSSGE